MTMPLHVCDGDRYWIAADMTEARRFADEAITTHRKRCDPEWSDAVESVAIYEAPADAEDPSEWRCLLIATSVPVEPLTEDRGYEWVDYVMREPEHTAQV